MYIIYYLLKVFIGCIVRGSSFKTTDVYKGFKLYNTTTNYIEFPQNSTESLMGGGKKHIFSVLRDLNYLSRINKCFPDSYFRFGMFMKNFGSREKMCSFLPQVTYANLCIQNSLPRSSRYNILIDDKILFHDIMSFYGIPVPHRYFIYRNGEFRSGNQLLSDNDVNDILRATKDNIIFMKRFTGGAASGVFVLKRDLENNWIDSNGNIINATSIKAIFPKEGIIFEKRLVQEHELGQFNPDSVNTIRVLTFKNSIVAATIRFGGIGSYVDNTAKGGVAVSLDIETGKLGEYGMREYDLTKYTEHPGTHLNFKNRYCSQWPKVKQLVEKCINFLPYYVSVGFDIATTDEGPVVIEINTGAGIYLSQMGKEYGLKKQFITN